MRARAKACAAADSYVEVQTLGEPVARAELQRETRAAGRPTSGPGGPFAGTILGTQGYVENFDYVSERLFAKAITIDHHRSLLDTVACETFTEVIAAGKDEPYLVGARIRLTARIAEIELMWSTTGYWGFDAEHYLKTATTEDWNPIPPAQRDTRKTLESVANAYMDALLLGQATVEPWGRPCVRTAPNGSCQVGTPVPAVNIANRHYVIDETIGAIAVLCTFGADPKSGRIRTPDAHLFRVENGKIRYVHAVTHLKVN